MQVTKKRTNTKRRANSRPRRKPNTSLARRPNTAVKVYAQRNRKVNPRRPRRKRNPQVMVLIKGSLYAAAGAWAQGLATNFIPLKAEGIAGIGIQLGIAYGVSMVAERFLGSGENAKFFAVGAAAGVGKSILDMVLGLAKGAVGQLAPAGAPTIGPQTPNPPNMGDIAAWGAGWNTPPQPGLSDISYYPASMQ